MTKKARPEPQYQHEDRTGRTLAQDQYVAFSTGWTNAVFVGQIERITAQRVRIRYQHRYRHRGELIQFETRYQARPENVLILNNIEPELMMMALKGQL